MRALQTSQTSWKVKKDPTTCLHARSPDSRITIKTIFLLLAAVQKSVLDSLVKSVGFPRQKENYGKRRI